MVGAVNGKAAPNGAADVSPPCAATTDLDVACAPRFGAGVKILFVLRFGIFSGLVVQVTELFDHFFET